MPPEVPIDDRTHGERFEVETAAGLTRRFLTREAARDHARLLAGMQSAHEVGVTPVLVRVTWRGEVLSEEAFD
jgi:hypothetical protein